MSKSFNVTLNDEAADVLRSVATERKKGEWLSALILDSTSKGEALDRIESRLARIENLLIGLVAERQQKNA